MPDKKSDALHPHHLAERQLAFDQARVYPGPSYREPRPGARSPDQIAIANLRAFIEKRKIARMSISPLAFLRGSAPIFYELLEAVPELAQGPDGQGWLLGDLHIENFGAFEPGPFQGAKVVPPPVFDVNDFDEAFIGPFRLDVLRFATSLLVGARELGTTGAESITLARTMLDAYVVTLFDAKPLPPRPACVKRLISTAADRRPEDFSRRYLDATGSHLKIGERLLDLGPRLRELAEAAFQKYLVDLPEAERPKNAHVEVLDTAFRIAGTGSLGGLRVAVLVRGRRGQWLFDMKAEPQPSGAFFAEKDELATAERVMIAQRSCVKDPPMLVGRTEMDGYSMLVRKLTEEEDKLDLSTLPKAALPELVGYLGALVGRAHSRGKQRVGLAHRWTKGDCSAIIDTAIELAGVHEAAYLAYSAMTMSTVATPPVH